MSVLVSILAIDPLLLIVVTAFTVFPIGVVVGCRASEHTTIWFAAHTLKNVVCSQCSKSLIKRN